MIIIIKLIPHLGHFIDWCMCKSHKIRNGKSVFLINDFTFIQETHSYWIQSFLWPLKRKSYSVMLYYQDISIQFTSWNQSIQVQLITAGNLRPLTLKVEPTGEKQRITLSCFLTLSMKNFQQFSLVSCSPAPLTSFLTILTIFSHSSSLKRSGISPEARRLFIKTKNRSSATYVNQKKENLCCNILNCEH